MQSVKKVIGSIEFGILSPQEIRKMSAVEVTVPDTYDDDGYPIEGGVMDKRMGVIDPGLRCETCGARAGECPGHFGHIELARPVIHVGFAKTIHRILESTCRECGRIKLTDEEIEEYMKKLELAKNRRSEVNKILKEIHKKARERMVCPHCGAPQFPIKFEKPTIYWEIRKDEQGNEYKHRMMPTEVRDRLEKIPDKDLPLLGLHPEKSRPEWMVLTVLPVPPVTVRPSITLETGIRAEDDLTHKLVDIIRINNRLKQNIEAGAPQLIIEDLWDLLQYHVTTYINNETSGVPPAKHKSGRPLKTLAQRLKGKEGRFRGNLSGKRVNFSARTVISPDPMISINEVGVPIQIAMELTVPEKVTEFNIEKLKKMVLNGPDKYPGANYVIDPDGKRIRIMESNREFLAERLDIGWTVERHLLDGDIVLFNRQPSLHRMSIMAHRVRVMPYKTFRLNLAVCPPYNADFDGDEMNLHVPQTEEAQAEARILMEVQNHILSPRYGGPIIGGIQDHISGGYLLTREGAYFTREEVEQMLMFAGVDIKELPEPDKYEDGKPLWSGKTIFSLLLPDDLTVWYRNKLCDEPERCEALEKLIEEKLIPDPEEVRKLAYDGFVYIQNGKLLSGAIDKKAYGREDGIILDLIVREYGVERARQFLDQVTKLAIWVITHKGFTTGIDDEDLPEEARDRIREIIREAEERVQRLIEAYKRGELEPLPGKTLEETLESKIMAVLAEARDNAGSIAEKYLGMDNHTVIMAKTGARGKILNITQMAALLGQQSIRGKRLYRGFKGRVLSHFKPGDLGARARGFVVNSYKSGLSPQEYFFHAMGGREGLVDTAVRTAQSGYMQRRLINALQDLKVDYDGTVRDPTGVIVQFKYGEDGVDPMKSWGGKTVDVDRIIVRTLLKVRANGKR
ncbi:DNA-directed RNA polymerase subunit A' [Thermococcus chitonophagus]|uniref:DNA-directed RNA polymerase subunit Rpo1N n=1 Tax=Thermococcus chitonophagus TaxID=54262 RepID=A0A160VTV1_9EURY|nr:DNA-directed RNA polymerase subunit A' [Thermococcus chitonophagus]ASJ16440.1 DNA-directed RNA polymerase subunit A' [Thermococcus chitonophagus]CUX78565.1 DNA-directed RNA polymerase subunit A' [Thermococcus chitonophagus]